jgi:hypothetical protein
MFLSAQGSWYQDRNAAKLLVTIQYLTREEIPTIMLQSFLNSVFGCSHPRTTFPITPTKKSNSTYVACLECGKEFSYDWKTMRVGAPIEKPTMAAVPATVVTERVVVRRAAAR